MNMNTLRSLSLLTLATPLALSPAATAATVTPVDAFTFDVFLDDVGDTASLRLPVTGRGGESAGPLDLFLLVDTSNSFRNDRPTLNRLLRDDSAAGFFPRVSSFTSDLRVGVGTFNEKPVAPQGGPDNYVYRTDLALTDDYASVVSAVETAEVVGNRSEEEASLEALQQAGLRVDEIGYRDNAKRVVVLSTDDAFHFAGDGTTTGLPVNNGDAVLDGTPPSSGEDYPSVEQVRTALIENDVTPIFAVTRGFLDVYEELVADLGRGAVVELDRDSSNLTAAVTDGLIRIGSDVKLTVDPTILSLVVGLDPAAGFDGVAAGETVFFDADITSAFAFDGATTVRFNSSTGETFTANVTMVPTPGAAWAGLLGLGSLLLRRRSAPTAR